MTSPIKRFGGAFVLLFFSFVFLASLLLLPKSSDSAGIAQVTIANSTPAVSEDDDGNRSVSVTFQNLTDGRANVVLPRSPDGSKCSWNEARKELAPATGGTLKVELDDQCEDPGDLVVRAEIPGGNPGEASFTVDPVKLEKAADPRWDRLFQGFVLGAALSIVLVVGMYVIWLWAGSAKLWPNAPLRYIGSTWSLKENWITDLTALAALFTAFFSTAGVVESFAGEEGEAMLAVSGVGAAIAVALVGFGPIVLQLTKRYRVASGERKGDFTVGGVLIGVVLVLTSALGQLWIAFQTGRAFEMDISDNWLLVAFAVAAVILILYCGRSLFDVLERGCTPPPTPPTPPDPVGEAARTLARPLWRDLGRNPEEEFLRGTEKDKLFKEALAATAKKELAAEKLAALEERLAEATKKSKIEELRTARNAAKEELDVAETEALDAARACVAAGVSDDTVDALDPAIPYELTVSELIGDELYAASYESAPPVYRATGPSAMI